MRRSLIALALGLASVSWGAPLVPEYEMQFADVSHLKKALNENLWAKEFSQSNLYRGSLVKLGPVLFAVGTANDDSWKGRLLDYLYEKILEGKRVGVTYFHRPGLVSPFGVSVFNLSAAEKGVLSLLLQKNKLSEPVETEIEISDTAKAKVKVQPVAIRLQKFAVVVGTDCLAVSRDPKVAAFLGSQCGKVVQKKNDAVLTINLKEFFPSWYPVLDRLAGIGRTAELSFDYDKRQACFVPAKAEVGLQKAHLMGTGSLKADFLSAIPADTLFHVTAFLPDPGRLNAANMESYFRDGKARAGKNPVPISVLYFGMHAGLNSRPEPMSAIILPQTDINDGLFTEVNKLFNENHRFEVKYAKVCGSLLALSPSKGALDMIAAACEKKQPSFAQMPQFLVKAFTEGPISSGAVVNLGGFLRSTLAYGWENNNPPPSDGKRTPGDIPREIAQAMDLLGRLPLYAFAGKVQNDKLALNGVKP